MTRHSLIAATLGGTVLLAAPAHAAQQGQTNQQSATQSQSDRTWVDIRQWDQTALYDGWSAYSLLNEDVYGSGGDVIGEVEDFIIGPDGRFLKVVVEGGGFLDIGDAHIAVPWNEVERTGSNSITVPVEEGNLGEYGMFDRVDDMPPKPQNWRLSNLLRDTVIADGTGYGLVEDVVFGNDGMIKAVVVQPSFGYGYGPGPYALPYQRDAVDPYTPYYRVPYATQELNELQRFDYRNFS